MGHRTHFCPFIFSRETDGISGREYRFLGTSGQTIDDIFKYLESEDRMEIVQQTLEWSHLAPTCPDTLCSSLSALSSLYIELMERSAIDEQGVIHSQTGILSSSIKLLTSISSGINRDSNPSWFKARKGRSVESCWYLGFASRVKSFWSIRNRSKPK